MTASTSATHKIAKQDSIVTKASSQNLSTNSRNFTHKPPKELDVSEITRVSDVRQNAIDDATIVNQVILEDINDETSPKRQPFIRNSRKQVPKEQLPMGSG